MGACVGGGARHITHHYLLVYIDDDGHRPTDRSVDGCTVRGEGRGAELKGGEQKKKVVGSGVV